MNEQNNTANENAAALDAFVRDLSKKLVIEKATTAATGNLEAFITELGGIFASAVAEFILTRQMQTDDLAAYNDQRLHALGDWIKTKLSELPPASQTS